MSAYEVYAFWNGKDVRLVLEAVTAIMGGSDYMGLLKGIALVGLLSAATYALLSQRGETLGSYLFGFVFVYGVIFVPRVDVIVNDVRASSTSVVSNVPLGLAVPYATLSHLGYWLTMEYESRFTTLDDERFSKTGMVFGARVLETMAKRPFPDAALRSDVATFYKDCIVPELIDDPSQAAVLRNSKTLSTTIDGIMNPGRGTSLGVVTFNGSTSMSCGSVVSAINAYLTTKATLTDDLAAQGHINRADYGRASSDSMLAATTETDVGNMLSNLLGISDTATTALKESMWINSISDADMALRNGYGNAAMTSYTAAATDQSSRQSAYAGKLWAEKALPLVRNIAEFVLIAIFPMIFIIMLVAGEKALMALKLYLGILASLSLWAPLTAVLNYMVISNGKEAFGSLTQTAAGLTLNNMTGAIDLALQQQALAGQLFLAVPVIAYAIVSAGAGAATTAMGSITSAASGAGGKVGGEAAMGNVGGGQVAWRNTNALNSSSGQNNSAFSQKANMAQFEGPGGMLTTSTNGRGGSFANVRSDQMGAVGASIGTNLQSAYQQASSGSLSTARQALSEAVKTVRETYGSGTRGDSISQAMLGANNAITSGKAADISNAAANLTSAIDSVQRGITGSTQGTTSFNAGLEGKLGTGGLPGLGAGASMGVSTRTDKSFGNGVGQTNQNQAVTNSNSGFNSSTTGGESNGLTGSASNSTQNTNTVQTGLDRAKEAANRASAAAVQSKKADEMASSTRTDSGRIDTDIASQVLSKVGGGGADAKSRALALAGSDMPAFNEAAKKAATEIVAAQGFGPSKSTQMTNLNGDAPITNAQVLGNKGVIEDAANKQVEGAPTQAAAPKGKTLNPDPVPNNSGKGTPRSRAVSPPPASAPPAPTMPGGAPDPRDSTGKTIVAPSAVVAKVDQTQATVAAEVAKNKATVANDKNKTNAAVNTFLGKDK